MKQTVLSLLFVLVVILNLGFTNSTPQYATAVADYYDKGLDNLIEELTTFRKLAQSEAPVSRLKSAFLSSRICYKNISFFVEQYDTRGARAVNGPDLLRIEDDTQNDSTFPHGFQRIEAILYEKSLVRSVLKEEIDHQLKSITALRHAPDHQYYFRNDKVWEALRSGTYRIISMGITGFDVPICLNALPETKAQLLSQRNVIELYQDELRQKDTTLYRETMQACNNALSFLGKAKDFNTFDRLTFIKDFLDPFSACLQKAAASLGYINTKQRTPLNPNAASLFAADIFSTDFFAPNDRYRNTPERVALGKRLFYDTKLSLNNSRSCASCHNPALAFTDGLAKGKHLDGKNDLLRNTPTLWNSVFQTRQFYDSRALVLETQLSAVVHSTEEMGGSLQDAAVVLAADESYLQAFQLAYKNDATQISPYTIANAISCYIRTLVSFNSRFDQYVRGQKVVYSVQEKNGFNLFMGKAKCGTCHYAPMFNGLVPPLYEETESEILAVPATHATKTLLDADEGKYLFTKTPLHRYAFKTPTVRNSALTAPYMHNGVFKTLDEVIDFYNNGGGAHLGINPGTQTLPADPLRLTPKEKNDLIAFLRSLTDTSASH